MQGLRRLALPAALALVVIGVAACADGASGDGDRGTRHSAGRFDQDRAFRDLKRQVRFGPRPAGSRANRRQVRFLARRLRAAGARGVRIQRPHRNVVARIPGGGDGVVVVGAHHDTKDGIPNFVGANDGASGVAVVLELARTLPRRRSGPTVHVALFDAEEARGERDFAQDGTRGSRQYVRYAKRERRRGRRGSPRLGRVKAMVLFDLVGDCDLQIPREANSDPGLYSLFKGKPFGGTAAAVSDDHVPFLREGIPAVDLIDFSYGPGGTPGRYFHTSEDTLDKVCPESLGEVGRASLRAIPRIR